LLSASAQGIFDPDNSSAQISGTRIDAQSGVQESTSDLMSRQAASGPKKPRPEHELEYPDRSQLPLKFLGQWGWGYQDVQLHVSEQPLQPLFYADTAKTVARAVTGARNRTSTRVGDVVCHRGERTGYSCAEVELVDFAPSGDLCGGACLATWVAVAGPTCKGGDSGAPVFNGTTAFGLVKGASYRGDGSCIFYFYMSTDYLPAGWSLLETPALPAAPTLGGAPLRAR